MNARAAFTQVMSAVPLHVPGHEGIDLIRACLPKLDLSSLVVGLRELGYRWDELRFASHASIESQRRLIHGVEVLDDPRRVLITLNLGLLGPQSPLPNYFFKELDAGRLDAATFFAFIGFFDHVVLSRHVAALHPEIERPRGREELQLLNLRSPATLHWLLQQVYPELAVQVAPITKQRRLRTGGISLGSAVLGGEGTFGGAAVAHGPGRRITLIADEELAGSGRVWPLEARARLDAHVLPLSRGVGLALEVFLVIREQQSWARLDGQTHLGYEPLRGKQARRRIEIYDTSKEDGT